MCSSPDSKSIDVEIFLVLGLYVMYMHMVKRRAKVLGGKSSKSKSD